MGLQKITMRKAARAALIALLGSSTSIQAQTPQSGFSFLKIGVGARSIGMGNASTALSNDATAIYWNTAGLASVSKREMALMHSAWLQNSSYDFIGMALPMANPKAGTFGVSMSQLSQPTQMGRDRNGRKTQSFKARDFAATLAYSRRMSHGFQAGMGIKMIQSQIATFKASGMAMDLGALYHMSNMPMSLGLSVSNLGTGAKYLNENTKYPLTVSAGAMFKAVSALSLALDVRQRVYDRKTTVSLGTEYALLGNFALRGGYKLGSSTGRNNNPLSGLVGGFGLKIMEYRLDYALTPFGELGDTHRLSLGVRF